MKEEDLNFVPPAGAVDHFRKLGLKTSVRGLAILRCRGGGPLFQRFGRRILYRPDALNAWFKQRISNPKSSTSSN